MTVWNRKRKERSHILGSQALYKDVMLDIETLGVGIKAKILSIGAVRFRPDTRDDINTLSHSDRTFYRRLSLGDQLLREEDEATLKWWKKQSKEARAVFDEEEVPVKSVLKDFAKFCEGATSIWGNGKEFDNVIVRDLYKDNKMSYPGYVSNDLDFRTLRTLWKNLTGMFNKEYVPKVEMGTRHNALADAKKQVLQVQKMWTDIRGTKYGTEEECK
jgi:hypothetical protein